MTSLAFLGFVFVAVVSALPAPQDDSDTLPSNDENTSSACQTRNTVCVDLYNGCGVRTGGCYDFCSPTTYSVPSCSPTSILVTPTAVPFTASIISTTISALNTGIFAEDLVLVEASLLPSPTSSSSGTSAPTSTTSPESAPSSQIPGSTLSSTSSPLPGLTSSSSPTPSPFVRGGVVLAVVDDGASSITTAPATVTTSTIACGRKTSCWDGMTSMNAVCPAVRYGGCYDVCKGDPKTIYTPVCHATASTTADAAAVVGRSVGKWRFLF